MAITDDQLNEQIQKMNTLMLDFGAKIGAWTEGVAGGGPNSDGKYPLPNGFGTYRLVACPAQVAADANKLQLAGPNGGIQLGFTAGFTSSGNSYAFKESDNGKVFFMTGNTNTTAITVLLPDNLPAGWSVMVVQIGDGRITARKANDSTNSNTNLRSRTANGFTTVNKGSVMVIICESRNSANANNFYTITGDVAA
jgi:hypothetical protein